MPLQGLEPKMKDDELKNICQGQLSLKQMKEAAKNVKRKRNVVKAFQKFTGEESCKSLQKRLSPACNGRKVRAI